MTAPLRFEILHRSGSCAARVGRVTTLHGSFDTPAFIPVGTRASVRGLTPDQLRETGARIILTNAYHLMLRPGADVIRRLGGCHVFMGWNGPLLTDSGGYQAFSMSDLNRVDDDGVTFRSIVDGARVRLTPERSMEVQNDLGADIIMAFDDCPPSVDPASSAAARRRMGIAAGPDRARTTDHAARLAVANERTIRWLERCVAAHARPQEQALFGIVQGGNSHELRTRSAAQVTNIDLPGYAIGGVAVGEEPGMIREAIEFTAPLLPEDKPRYLMGVGYERDLVLAIRAGVDMFDCVLPTRNGRNGTAFTRTGRIHLRNAEFAEDGAPIDPCCECSVCRGDFSRAFLRHLFMSREMLGPILTSMHNLSHFQRLMLDIGRAVRDNEWSFLAREWPVLEAAARAPGCTT